ncbi:MAG: PQQ-binding-like beta-propeller repeat protein [Gemmataceae bacterium]|nr:PQQ-binding-like beta-propeller repeat protein [Gemmataceae bacterium]
MLRPLLLLLFSMTTLIYSEDSWPTWRGPQANGVAPKTAQPPTKWDEKNNIKWKIPLSGKGSATPIVWGDQIFVVTATKTDRLAKPEELPKIDPTFQTKTTPPNHFYRFEVFCYDRHTGKEIWKQLANEAIPHEGHHETHSYAAGSPTTDGKRLYVSFGSFGIYAYDLSGKLLWRRDLGRIHSRLGWGEAVTPVVYGDSLILNWDQEANSKLIVLDASTGKTKWEAQRDEKTSWNTPFVVDHQGQTQVIINGTNRIRSYDLKEGKVLWEVGGMTVNAIPSPLVSEGVAYIMSGYRGAAAVAVPLNSKGELKENQVLWRHGKGTPYVPSPILYEGRLYFTAANTPVLTVLDAKTGKVLLEGERLPKLSSFYSSPMIAGGHLYLADRNGTTAVLTLGDKPEVVSLNKLDDSFDASPVTVGKTLYLRGEKYLYAIEEKK